MKAYYNSFQAGQNGTPAPNEAADVSEVTRSIRPAESGTPSGYEDPTVTGSAINIKNGDIIETPLE